MVQSPQQSGLSETAVVRRYLGALEDPPPRKKVRSSERVRADLARVNEDAATNALDRLLLVQRRLDLEQELAEVEDGGSDDDETAYLEEAFVSVAAAYSDRKGLSYDTWREVGVPAAVLKKAGITR